MQLYHGSDHDNGISGERGGPEEGGGVLHAYLVLVNKASVRRLSTVHASYDTGKMLVQGRNRQVCSLQALERILFPRFLKEPVDLHASFYTSPIAMSPLADARGADVTRTDSQRANCQHRHGDSIAGTHVSIISTSVRPNHSSLTSYLV